ncbi:MAG: multiple sugar transport system permease protein [Frankiales bacterium]|jgi:multiple sugar transport system permease protein|nr:multiple sugar transport system permease protein [Frankiales bacterium]
MAAATTAEPIAPASRPLRRKHGGGTRGPERTTGWLFVSPAVALLVLFLAVPVLMALWVSFTDWNGIGTPFRLNVPKAGLRNYTDLFTKDGLTRQDFMTSIRNIFYYTLLVVPLQTSLALSLALLVNGKMLKAKGFFRSAFYFPSVTSSVAITTVFLFVFNGGALNSILAKVGISGPNWLNDSNGVVQNLLGALGIADPANPPSALVNHGFLSLTWWDWIAGPSVAMCAIIALVVWTTAGTFMVIYLAALQDISADIEEASLLDGANPWQRLRYVVLPMLKPTTFLVLTLGLIGSWQVFDQVYLATQGGPDKTTLSPAYLSYTSGFKDHSWGVGSAMAFVLFAIIIIFTLLQRFIMRDRTEAKARSRRRAARRAKVG